MTPLLVQVRGASGSGKSTLVRTFLEGLGQSIRYMDRAAWGLGHVDSPASRPFALGYRLGLGNTLVVPGHYDAPGGGCDMIKKADHAYDIADRADSHGAHVLMEGLFISKEYARLIERAGRAPLVIYLDLPEVECEESVQQRREALGKERRPLSKHGPDWREVRRAVARLEAAGLAVERHSRDSALARLKEVFA